MVAWIEKFPTINEKSQSAIPSHPHTGLGAGCVKRLNAAKIRQTNAQI
jgi:hypothetical protein